MSNNLEGDDDEKLQDTPGELRKIRKTLNEISLALFILCGIQACNACSGCASSKAENTKLANPIECVETK